MVNVLKYAQSEPTDLSYHVSHAEQDAHNALIYCTAQTAQQTITFMISNVCQIVRLELILMSGPMEPMLITEYKMDNVCPVQAHV